MFQNIVIFHFEFITRFWNEVDLSAQIFKSIQIKFSTIIEVCIYVNIEGK